MATSFRLLREALRQLSLEPDEQRQHLSGAVVTDELVLDLSNAVESLPSAEEASGIRLEPDVAAELRRLVSLLDASPGDPLWDDESLDLHPTWAAAREQARLLLPRLPQR